jgi:hypothetical protein
MSADPMATVCPKWGVDLDDLLDRAGHANVLYVAGPLQSPRPPFELNRPHPNIQGLLAFREVSARTMSMLPGLRFAELAGEPIAPDVQAALPARLEEIWASRLDLELLSRLENLQFLSTRLTHGRRVQCRSIAELSQLRIVRVECAEPMRGAEAFGRLEHLEELTIERVATLDFAAWASCRRLRKLNMKSPGGSDDLRGIEVLAGLQTFSLGGRRCPAIGALRRLPRLEVLGLGTIQRPDDLEIVAELTGLRSLFLSTGSIDSPTTLSGASLFSAMRRLESLTCLTFLEDKDLTPLAQLKELRYLAFLGMFPEEAVRSLQDSLPNCKIDLTIGEPVAAPPVQKIGPLLATHEEDGRWTVFQDLSAALDLENNHEVEDALRRELANAADEVFQRVQFDSEAEAFCVYTESRSDIERITSALKALKRRRRVSSRGR